MVNFQEMLNSKCAKAWENFIRASNTFYTITFILIMGVADRQYSIM